MEKAMITALLEKYWQAETTVEEEKALSEYFGGPGANPDPEFQQYRALFAYYDEEARVTPGPDFETRILQHIGIAETPIRTIHSFRAGLTSAAAIIAAVVISLFLLKPANPIRIAETHKMPTIKDTYDDPQQALAAVRHALLVASTHLNEGRKQITK